VDWTTDSSIGSCYCDLAVRSFWCWRREVVSFRSGDFAASAGDADSGVLGPVAAGLLAPVLPESQPASVMTAESNPSTPGFRHRVKGS